jgi:hypothetical protein
MQRWLLIEWDAEAVANVRWIGETRVTMHWLGKNAKNTVELRHRTRASGRTRAIS